APVDRDNWTATEITATDGEATGWNHHAFSIRRFSFCRCFVRRLYCIPRPVQRQLDSRMRLRPLPRRDMIDRQRQHGEPHAGPHFRSARLHGSIGLTLRDEALEAQPEIPPGLATLVIQQIVVALYEEEPRHGGLAHGAGHQLAGELGELLAR